MKKLELLAASALALILATPAMAQDTAEPGAVAPAEEDTGAIDEIVVTAQRQSERLQDVPISVSASTAEALESQQIENPLDLQLSLPNITYTKTNFTSSSFTIRGIGDLCVGFSCDSATQIAINEQPSGVRLFEAEFFDLERIEVLRGPQATLFGRNATSGVVNFITARPNLDEIQASVQGEYGNFESIKVNGMINVPLGDSIGVRVAGYYLKRDGYTFNEFDGRDVDDRDLYAVRGTIRFQPTDSTTLDIIGYYFKEDDNRNRIQKQLCNRDPTGVLGCSPDRLEFEVLNGNSTLGTLFASREFLAVGIGGPLLQAAGQAAAGGNLALAAQLQGLATAAPNFGLGSVYGPDIYSSATNPADLRRINSDFVPTYRAEDYFVQARLEQELGDTLNLTLGGVYSVSKIDSRTDYNLAAPNDLRMNPGIAAFRGFPLFDAAEARLFQGTNICVSETNLQYSGVFGGNTFGCAVRSTDYDRSRSRTESYSFEGQVASDFDGAFNFLVGGIYLKADVDGDYFVASSGLDYASAVIGGLQTGGTSFFAPPFFNSETDKFTLKSYGIFGEAYVEFADNLKLTLGARYSNDEKFVRDRSPLFNFNAALTNPTPFDPPPASYDANASLAGNQAFREAQVNFDEVTGRAVLDWKPTDDTLIYLSYSRGYKSGGINPPFNPALFSAPATFEPEIINAYEIGTKNTLMNGTLQLNANAFYYDYKDLQLSRILNRTSFNDNTDAEIYGAELEAVVRPDRDVLVNLSLSYLKSKIKGLSLADPRDPSGGRSDTVIIKDITTAANCVVQPTTPGNAVGANTLVGAVNGGIGTSLGNPALLRPPTPVPGTNTTGAFSVCSALLGAIVNPSAPLRALFGTPTGPLPFVFNVSPTGTPTGLPDGVPIDLSGNELPQAPNWKFSAGIQYTIDFANGMSLVPRADLTYTGEFFSRQFNRPIDKVQGYEVVNAQIQLNGPEEKWFVRGFVQNLTKNDAITGQYVTDQSSGLFTNVFTLEPRRYGIAAGMKF